MVPFGFSVGDFIAGINLLIGAIHSLSDTNGAQADYEGLGRQLSNLKNGFECIEGLNLDDTQIAQVSAVATVLSDCRLCIDDFTKRNSRFKSLEVPCGGMRDEVQVHRRNQERAFVAHDTTTTQVLTEIERINSQIRALPSSAKSENEDANNIMVTIFDNQQQLMDQLRDIDLMIRVNQEVPAQVLLSKPVILLDARGHYAPFHLEFIDTAEAFIAVLKIRFKDIGLHKIESGEFALEDPKSKRGLQLAKPWTAIIRPSQHINMSMVFRLEEQQTARCPGCGKENAGSDLEDIECGNILCGITYRNIVEESAARTNESNTSPRAESERGLLPGSEPQLRRPSKANPSTNDEMQYYTRLHIVTQAIVSRLEDGSDYLPPPERSPTPERRRRLLNGKKRHPNAQASQGGDVLIDYREGLIYPDLAKKVDKMPLDSSDDSDSDIDDLIDIERREQEHEKNQPPTGNLVLHLSDDALLIGGKYGHDNLKNEHSPPARLKFPTRSCPPGPKAVKHI